MPARRSAVTAVLMALALAADWVFGEPRRGHPLVAFGRITRAVERRLYAPRRIRGACGVALLVLPPTLLAAAASAALPTLAAAALNLALLYFALGNRSLHDHVWPIAAALTAGDTDAARQLTAGIVSRDAEAIDPAPAAIESVLENGNDGVFGALFWFVVAGGAGALAFRLVNTLDALWGYRNPRFARFGWAAAKLDDWMNWLPARLTALSYALLGNTRNALNCWRRQAPLWDSPNAGPVMASGAGALGVVLGGSAIYHGEVHARPELGRGQAPQARHIEHALDLVWAGVGVWLLALLFGGWLYA